MRYNSKPASLYISSRSSILIPDLCLCSLPDKERVPYSSETKLVRSQSITEKPEEGGEDDDDDEEEERRRAIGLCLSLSRVH